MKTRSQSKKIVTCDKRGDSVSKQYPSSKFNTIPTRNYSINLSSDSDSEPDEWEPGLQLMNNSNMIVEKETELKNSTVLDNLTRGEDYNLLVKKNNNMKILKIIQWNVNAIFPKRIDEVKILAGQYSPDLMMIQETHLNETNSTPNIPGYYCARTDRIDKNFRGGGIITYIKKDNKKFLNYKIEEINDEKDVSAGIHKIEIDTVFGKILAINIYRNSTLINHDSYTLKIEKWVSEYKPKHVIVAGDLNAACENSSYTTVTDDGKKFDAWLNDSTFNHIKFNQKTFHSKSTQTWTTPDILLYIYTKNIHFT